MGNKGKIKWLKRYIACGRLAEQIENELAQWRSIAEKTTTSIQPVPGGGGAGDKIPLAVEHIVELEEKLKAKKNECMHCRLAIETAIAEVQEERLQLVLRHLYVDGITLDRVAVKMGYSYDWVKELHKRALFLVKEPPQTPRNM